MIPDSRLLNWMQDLMLNTSSSPPHLLLLQRRMHSTYTFPSSYELDSNSDDMNQHNFFSPLSLVMLEGKNPVLTLVIEVQVVSVTREKLHLIADTNSKSCTVPWGNENGPAGLWIQSSSNWGFWGTLEMGFQLVKNLLQTLVLFNGTSAGNVYWFTDKVKNKLNCWLNEIRILHISCSNK